MSPLRFADRPQPFRLEPLESRTLLSASSDIADDHGDDAASATKVDLAAAFRGMIEGSGDADWFRFEASAGQTYVFNSVGYKQFSIVDGSTTARFFSPHIGDDTSRGWLQWTASRTGRFHLRVENYVSAIGWSSERGPYTVRASRLDVEDAKGASQATALTCDQEMTARLAHTADVNWFRFEAVEGRIYTFSASPQTPALGDLVLQVVDADGHQLFGDPLAKSRVHETAPINAEYSLWGFEGFADSLNWIAPADGTYYLSVMAENATATGDYAIRLTELIDDHRGTAANATALTRGRKVRGEIDHEQDADLFSLDVRAGRAYALSATFDAPESAWTHFHLTDESFRDQQDVLSSSGPHLQFIASKTGTLTFKVLADPGVKYVLRAIRLTPRPADRSTAPLLKPGTLEARIERPGELRYYRFRAKRGDRYALRFTPQPPLDGVAAAVINPDGGIFSPNAGVLADGWTAHRTGIHYVAVAATNPSQTGIFSIELERTPDAPDGPRTTAVLSAGQPVTGYGAARSDHDWYRFTAVAGRSYQFDLDAKVVVEVVSRKGRQTLFSDETRCCSYGTTAWTPAESGTYFVVIRLEDFPSQQAYSLRITPAPRLTP